MAKNKPPVVGEEPTVTVAKITSRQLFITGLITALITATTTIIVCLITVMSNKSKPDTASTSDEIINSRDSIIKLGFSSRRTYLKYYVTISDSSLSNIPLLGKRNKSNYLFYRSDLIYERLPSWENEKLYVVLITQPEKYANWLQADNVIYREVVGVNSEDQNWLGNTINLISNENDLANRLIKLENLMKLTFKIDNNEMPLLDFKVEAFGFSLCYKNPNYLNHKKKSIYSFECYTFQPKGLKEFPIVIPELTADLDMKVDYNNASLNNVDYFAAFTLGEKGKYYPEINLDTQNKVLSVKSKNNGISLPGGGVLLKWK